MKLPGALEVALEPAVLPPTLLEQSRKAREAGGLAILKVSCTVLLLACVFALFAMGGCGG